LKVFSKKKIEIFHKTVTHMILYSILSLDGGARLQNLLSASKIKATMLWV
jgi:hypothetical protein